MDDCCASNVDGFRGETVAAEFGDGLAGDDDVLLLLLYGRDGDGVWLLLPCVFCCQNRRALRTGDRTVETGEGSRADCECSELAFSAPLCLATTSLEEA